MSDEYLIGFATEVTGVDAADQTPAVLEMQRRLKMAVGDLTAQSERQIAELIRLSQQTSAQNATLIRLTRWIVTLTIVLGIIAVIQLWAMLSTS